MVAVVPMVVVAPMVAVLQQAGCMELEQVLAMELAVLVHVEFLRERIAQLAASAAVVVGLALEQCPMWAPAKEGTFRRRPTSMLVMEEISTQFAREETSHASLQHAAS